MDHYTYPKLILPPNFDELAQIEINQKGWFDARVELGDGSQYELHFYDPVRFGQECTYAFGRGEPCYAETNIVVMPELTIEAIEKSIRSLWIKNKKGFFSLLKNVNTDT